MKIEIEWRVIREFPRYELNNMGEVRRISDGFRLGSTLRGNKYWYKLQGEWKHKDVQLNHLMSQTFPELSS